MQKLAVGQDTEVIPAAESTNAGALQLLPSKLSAFPSASTAMQKLAVGQDTEVIPAAESTNAGALQANPETRGARAAFCPGIDSEVQ
jgi:hypothetical protein